MKNSGFSLFEVLIAWLILSMALLGLAEILTQEINQTEKIYREALTKLQVRDALV